MGASIVGSSSEGSLINGAIRGVGGGASSKGPLADGAVNGSAARSGAKAPAKVVTGAALARSIAGVDTTMAQGSSGWLTVS